MHEVRKRKGKGKQWVGRKRMRLRACIMSARTKHILWYSRITNAGDGSFEAVGELLIYNDPERPMLCGTSVHPMYIHNKTRRVSFDEMPEAWQNAYRMYLNQGEPTPPESIRGLWRVS